MHPQDEFEIRHVHLGEGLVAQDPGVVDENVDPAPVPLRALRHFGDLREVGDVRRIGDRFAAQGADLVNDREERYRRLRRRGRGR